MVSSSEDSKELEAANSEWLDLDHLSLPVDLAEVHAFQWILQKSTDTDITAAAARMVPEIELPMEVDGMLEQLDRHLYACFDPARQIFPVAQEQAVACVKAMYHFSMERNLDIPFLIGDGEIFSERDGYLYKIHIGEGFLPIACAVGDSNELDITSLMIPDRMWMAHMFTYRLHDRIIGPKVVTFLLEFIRFCFREPSPSGRLVADCLLIAGMLMGLRVDCQHLSRLDKRYD